ncbi:MAG: hypothetical protein WKF42_05110 [Solirubrobacteraceae bacterium]
MGPVADEPATAAGGTPEDADVARIRRRLARMSPQTKALRLALARYRDDGGEFDLGRWEAAFTATDPQVINEVLGVTGGYEGLVNHLMEMLHAGASLAGLPVARQRRPQAPMLIAAARTDGCFSEHQADVLTKLNRTRNRLQHNSPGVPADEVHQRLELLLKTLPGLLRSYVTWIEGHGLQLLPKQKR